ncbi:hypothetical protein [Lysinibacter cavernae]|uniref:Integral membrane protein n=1 Tax=Lysinibacter cavernae TaxID=1640652 RepID=A0A7X5R0Q4_9MICO|nr:hypothetical protein [Lysinibacter cavernae]NIH53550.1 hypothetical protein [Lysinibacter cavernae]
MDILHNVLLVLHFIGIGSLLGGFMTQMKQLKPGTAVVNAAMFHGALTMLVSGLLLVATTYMSGEGDYVNNAKIGVKLAILIVISVLVIINRKKATVPSGVIGAIGGLTVVNIILAVFWK